MFIFAPMFLHFSNICFFLLSFFFLLPIHFILKFVFWVFFLLFIFQCGSVICFMMVFSQYVCPNASSSLFRVSLLFSGVKKGWKFRRKLLLDGSGGEVRPNTSHRSLVTSQQASSSRCGAGRGWASCPPGHKLRKQTLDNGLISSHGPHHKSNSFYSRFPQVYRKKNNLIFAVAFQCNKLLSGDLNRISILCKNVHSMWLFTSSIWFPQSILILQFTTFWDFVLLESHGITCQNLPIQ